MFIKASRYLLLSGVAVAGTIGTAQAQSGTIAGTSVTNTATASFTVNGAPQTVASNPATFLVDRKVNLTVTKLQAANTQVNLGQAGASVAFRVTNNTNAPQDFLLAASQALSVGLLPANDNFDLANIRVFVDANDNNSYDPGVDTAGFIDELAPDASRTVFIVGDVPGTPTANLAFVGLDVTVAAGGAATATGAALTQDLTNQNSRVDVVFADNDSEGDGDLIGDSAHNGHGWAYASFEVGVRSVNLTVTKTATVLSDGVSLGGDAKALPGAIVQYCLTVSNATALTPASNVNLTDVIPANTTYDPGSITVGGIGVGGVCLVGGVPIADDGSTTGLYTGSFNAGTKTVTATIPVLPGNTSVAASFRVTIN